MPRSALDRLTWCLAALAVSACGADSETGAGGAAHDGRGGDPGDPGPGTDAAAAADTGLGTDAATAPDAESRSDAAGSLDAAPPPPDLGWAPEPDPCPAACDRVVACVASECAAAADGLGDATSAACLVECRANPAFGLESDGFEACGDLLGWAATAIGAPLADGCAAGPGDSTHHAVCDLLGSLVARCAPEKCPPAADVLPIVAHAYVIFCDNAVNSGQIDADLLGGFIRPDTSCDAGPVAQAIDQAVSPGGNLGAFCAQGPFMAPVTCEKSCSVLSPCIPEGSPFAPARDPLLCQYYCVVTTEVRPEVWTCGAGLPPGGDCDAAVSCLR